MAAPGPGRFDVRATRADGRDASQRGVEAGSVAELLGRFRRDGLQVSEVRSRDARRLFEPRAVSSEEFAIFNAELAAACRRGVPLPGALRALSREMRGRRFRRAADEAAAAVEAGRDLGAALAGHPAAFPPAYVALVRAGLAAGDLGGILLVFSREARLTGQLRRNTTGALVYPGLVLAVASLIMAMIGWTLLPFVQEMAAGIPMPALDEFLLSLAPAMRWAPLIVGGLIAAAAGGWRLLAAGRARARWLAAAQFKVPFVGPFLRAVALTRFCRTLAAALAGRVPVPDAVCLAGLATGNPAVAAAADAAAAAVREGTPMSEGLEGASRLFPATLVWMLGLGESRGEAVPALEEYAQLQQEAAERLGRAVPAVAAALAVTAAAALLFLSILSLMQPMFRLLAAVNEIA
jgi:type II secretory pathway component PulF